MEPSWCHPLVCGLFFYPVKVWIIGDSYVRRGAENAAETMGSNLVDDSFIHWFGWGGLRWKNLLHVFCQSLQGRAASDVLLDLGDLSSVSLIAAMKEDLHHLHLQYPGMKVTFPGFTQRCRWKAGANPGKPDKSRSLCMNMYECNMYEFLNKSNMFNILIIQEHIDGNFARID